MLQKSFRLRHPPELGRQARTLHQHGDRLRIRRAGVALVKRKRTLHIGHRLGEFPRTLPHGRHVGEETRHLGPIRREGSRERGFQGAVDRLGLAEAPKLSEAGREVEAPDDRQSVIGSVKAQGALVGRPGRSGGVACRLLWRRGWTRLRPGWAGERHGGPERDQKQGRRSRAAGGLQARAHGTLRPTKMPSPAWTGAPGVARTETLPAISGGRRRVSTGPKNPPLMFIVDSLPVWFSVPPNWLRAARLGAARVPLYWRPAKLASTWPDRLAKFQLFRNEPT